MTVLILINDAPDGTEKAYDGIIPSCVPCADKLLHRAIDSLTIVRMMQ